MGDGDDQKTFQEVVEDTVLPDPKWDAWLLERKFPEEYSRKHLDVTATVTNTEPPAPMHLVIVDPVKKREDAEADAPLTSNGLKGVSRAVAPQIWRGMWSDGGHHSSMDSSELRDELQKAAPGGATDPVHFALQNTGLREWI